MRRHDLKPVLIAFLLAGCASAGAGGEGEPRVPVYRSDEETPCEDESMGAVTAEVPAHLRSGRDFEAARERELGEAGAEEGADAVILPESPRQLTVVRVVGGQFRAAPPSLEPIRVEGIAVR